MVTLTIIVLGNSGIFMLTYWFGRSSIVQRFGGSNLPNVIALGSICIALEMFLFNKGIEVGDVITSEETAVTMAIGLASAIPWIFSFFGIMYRYRYRYG